MRSPALVVMAAGLGSRYGGIKQIDPVGPSGEILLDYSVYDAIRSGFDDVIFVVREEIETALRDRVAPTIARRCKVRYARQRIDDVPAGFTVPPGRRKPWGTAHAVLACRDLLRGPFAVINADDAYGRRAYEVLYRFLTDTASPDVALVGYPLRATLTEHGDVSRGVCRLNADGTLAEIRERKRVRRFGESVRYADADGRWHELNPDAVASMNMWGFPNAILGELEARFERFLGARSTDLQAGEFLLPDAVGELVREGLGTVRVLPTSETWFGVTYPEDGERVRRRLRRLIAEGVYPESLWGAAVS